MKLKVGSYIINFNFSIEKKKKRKSGPRPGARKCPCGSDIPKKNHTVKQCQNKPLPITTPDG
jgi:hypothetical protein